MKTNSSAVENHGSDNSDHDASGRKFRETTTLDELVGMLRVRSAGERVWLPDTVGDSLLAEAAACLEKQVPELRFLTGEDRTSPQGKRRFIDVRLQDSDAPAKERCDRPADVNKDDSVDLGGLGPRAA